MTQYNTRRDVCAATDGMIDVIDGTIRQESAYMKSQCMKLIREQCTVAELESENTLRTYAFLNCPINDLVSKRAR